MNLRPYNPKKDFEGVKEVIQSAQTKECWPYYYPNGWDDKRIWQEFDPVENYRHSIFLVSEENGKITGLIAGHDLNSFINNEVPHLRSRFNQGFRDAFYQRDIIIHPDFQNRVVGFRLFRAMQKHAKKKGYIRLVTRTPPRNERGINFFERLGFFEIFRNRNPERIYFVMELGERK
jgi:GNAT superfamily N-acetyltransferase